MTENSFDDIDERNDEVLDMQKSQNGPNGYKFNKQLGGSNVDSDFLRDSESVSQMIRGGNTKFLQKQESLNRLGGTMGGSSQKQSATPSQTPSRSNPPKKQIKDQQLLQNSQLREQEREKMINGAGDNSL